MKHVKMPAHIPTVLDWPTPKSAKENMYEVILLSCLHMRLVKFPNEFCKGDSLRCPTCEGL